jgi:hypothetical protein
MPHHKRDEPPASGRSKIATGEPARADGQEGGWSRERLVKMDRAFRQRVERSIAAGDEGSEPRSQTNNHATAISSEPDAACGQSVSTVPSEALHRPQRPGRKGKNCVSGYCWFKPCRSVRPIGLNREQGTPMPLQGEAKKDYQREYMRRRRAGLPTRASKPKGKCCSLCGQPPSRERIVIASGRGIRICECCVAEASALIAAQHAS